MAHTRLRIAFGFVGVLHRELKFLKIFVGWLSKCEEAGKDIKLVNAIARLEAGLSTLLIVNDNNGAGNMDSVAHTLVRRFGQLELDITNMIAFLIGSLKSMSCTSDEILEFIDCLIENLANLKADVIVSVKDRIMVLGRNISVLRTLVYFSARRRCIDSQILEDFLNYVKSSLHDAAYVSFLCLLRGKDEMKALGLETMFSVLLQKFIPGSPIILGRLLGVLRSDKFQVNQDAVRLVDLYFKV
ncbi:OLC1v1035994C1 [Oldenlandia corymbosa var. corymbosa]|uniref:OLC1v1035994C1 n=1 Tax=Oldenlandia corymbosa var. corymbosa TaxID=529605 RepID=A0AAV1CUB5_OLDCO|nr:OLC1v1035994C1 [Oldenlandia corymbosa var. corymbosa]